jgi:hypothetical protein
MIYELKITDKNNNEFTYNLSCKLTEGPKNINDFILELLSISEDKRILPLFIQCPNGLEVYPSIKMKFENYGSPLLGDKLEAMVITY